MDNTENAINVLWTGGLDSTYRICELSRHHVTVRPIYIKDDVRGSVSKELLAMEKIRELLKHHPETKFNFLPTMIIAKKNIPANSRITASYNLLHNKYSLGSQYDFLARLADSLNDDLEVGVTFDPRGKVARTIYGEGAITKETTGGGISIS